MPDRRNEVERIIRECRELVEKIKNDVTTCRQTRHLGRHGRRGGCVEHSLDHASRTSVARRLADLRRQVRRLETGVWESHDGAHPEQPGGTATYW